MCSSCFLLQHPDPKQLQIAVTGFLNGKNARIFMGELWSHLVSAQENIGGIPADFLAKKKEEIRMRKVCCFSLFGPTLYRLGMDIGVGNN